MRVIDNGCSVDGGRCQFIHGLCRSVRKADRCQLSHVTSMGQENPSQSDPTGCLVKREPAWADFFGSGGFFSYWGLRLQPGLFLSASQALVRETRPKGLGIPWVAARP